MNFQPLKEFLDTYIPMLGIPGSDTVIYKDHEEIFRYCSGFDSLKKLTPVRRDALYNLYSCTKIATCTSIMQLVERGEILVTDPVYAYIPEYKDLTVNVFENGVLVGTRRAEKPMLIRHLLTMSAGLDYNRDRRSVTETQKNTGGRCPTLDFIRALASDPLNYEPGEGYSYSLAHDILGGIIEVVSGDTLGGYMKKNIFEPLGMKDTGFCISEENRHRLATQYDYDTEKGVPVEIPSDSNILRFGTEYESGGAGLISSVDDYILLMDALAHLGIGKNGNRILSSYAVNLMRENALRSDQLAVFANGYTAGYGYGYGVRVKMSGTEGGNIVPTGTFGWDGAKLCLAMADPASKVAVFHAEHMGAFHHLLIPRLRNVIYFCLDEV